MKDVNTRIMQIMREKNLNKNSLSKVLNVSQPALKKIEDNKNAPSFKLLFELLTNFPDISPEWLLTGSGEMYRQKDSTTNGKETISIELYRDMKKQNEDLILILKQCQNQIEELIKINKQLSSPNNGGNGRNDAPLALNAGCADVG